MERNVSENNIISQSLRKLTYGFYIVTAGQGEEKAAGTVCWVSQISFEPPLVMIAIKNGSKLNQMIESGGKFAINIIGKADKPMISPFARETKVDNGKINGYSYQEGKTGVPIFNQVPAIVECEVNDKSTPGDHTIFIGKVVNSIVNNKDAEPLIEWETDFRYSG